MNFRHPKKFSDEQLIEDDIQLIIEEFVREQRLVESFVHNRFRINHWCEINCLLAES